MSPGQKIDKRGRRRPWSRRAIDPHPILRAWQDRRDVAPGAWLARYGEDTAERPGALVEVRDFIAGE